MFLQFFKDLLGRVAWVEQVNVADVCNPNSVTLLQREALRLLVLALFLLARCFLLHL